MRAHSEDPGNTVRAVALVASLVAVAAVEQQVMALPLWLAVCALVLVLGLVFRIAPRPARAATDSARWIWLAVSAAFALGVFFRLRYLQTVPPGWGSEPLAFVAFARHLLDAGFPYEPYSWYAHTLYSYVIAVVMLLGPSDLMAFRIASAAISIATLAAVFAALRLLFGTRTAAVALALLASSYWHLFASRNGYHQQLLPLLQGLFLYGLAVGLLRQQLYGWVVAAGAMVLGLHAHWGYYLMPVYWAAVCAYLVVLHRLLWRRNVRPMLISAGMAAMWTSPLAVFFFYNAQTLDYVFRGFTLGASGAADVASKLAHNLRYVGWALSGNAAAPVEFGTRVDALVAAAALVGVSVSLRFVLYSVPHALVLLLLAVNVAGLAATITNSFYITATLVAVYALAAVGLTAIWEQLERAGPRLAGLFVAGFLALVAWQARGNYEEFFGRRIFTELKEPYHPPGTFFLLFDAIGDSGGRRAVFVARDEPGRDFDAPLREFAKQLPSFAFLLDTHPFTVETILFPPALLGAAEAVEIWVPNVAYVEKLLVPALRGFYPGLSVATMAPPPPYAAKDSTTAAFRISIPRAEIVAYHGLREGSGLLYVPADGRYRFRPRADAAAAGRAAGCLLIHEQAVVWEDGVTPGVLLEGGLHPLRLTAGCSSSAIEMRAADGEWERLDDFLLNANGHADAELAPYIARPGRLADFFYQLRLILPRPADVRAVEVEADGSFVTAGLDALRWHAADGTVQRQLSVDGGFPKLLARTAQGLLRVDEDGVWWVVEPQAFTRRGAIECEPAEILAAGIAVVCRGGEVRGLGAAAPLTQLTTASGPGLMLATDAAQVGDDIVVTDEQSGRLWRFGNDGRGFDWRAMAGIYARSDVEVDPRGNLHVKRWSHGIKTYSSDGYLLFNPTTERPALFLRAAGSDADTQPLHRLRFNGTKAIAIGVREFVYTFERVGAGR